MKKVQHDWIPTLVAGVPVIFGLLFIFRSSFNYAGVRFFTLFDDAMISMKYAKTFASGSGLVWFPGAPRVEGITNPFWTLIMAGFHIFPLSGSQISLCISLLSLVLLFLTYQFHANFFIKQAQGKNVPLALLLIFAASSTYNFSIVFWSLRGMETALLVFLQSFLVIKCISFADYRYLNRNKYYLVWCAVFIGIATRVDFCIIPIGLAIGLFMLQYFHIRKRNSPIFPLNPLSLNLLLATLSTLTIVFFFQRIYYGSFLPNTYYLKVSQFSFIDKFSRGFVTTSKLVPFILCLIFLFNLFLKSRISKELSSKLFLLFCALIPGILYQISIGGDAWEQSGMLNRYSISSVNILSIMLCLILVEIIDRHEREGIAQFTARKYFILSTFLALSFLFHAVIPNPYSFHKKRAFFLFFVASLLLIILWKLINWSHDRFKVVVSVFSVSFFLIASSLIPVLDWTKNGAFSADGDSKVTISTIELSKVITKKAVVATVWAGAPSYYLSNAMIDILGKSDPAIANSQPSHLLDFWPGHSKWNYEYSIHKLSPDVVTSLWFHEATEVKEINSWGYRRLCFGSGESAYFKTSSTEVLWDFLRACDY